MKSATLILGVALLAACQNRGSQAKVDAVPPAGAAAAGPNRDTVVARIDGEAITEGELRDHIKPELVRTEHEHLEKVHEMRTQGLEDVINRRLVERKAKKDKLTVEKLLERDVVAKVAAPTDAELKALYDQATATGRQLPPFEEIRKEISDYIRQQKMQQALEAYHGQLRAEAKVETLLPPLLLPKVEVAAVGPSTGDAKAPVTIVEFSDYECPFCKRAEPTVKQVLAEYKGKVRLVFRQFPLSIHPRARKASEAALCANDQGKYWQMHDKLFEHQDALEVPQLKQYARDLKLDGAKFDACLDGGTKAKEIDASMKAGAEAGVSGTPAFFINGRPLSGAQPFERFKEVIDAELAVAAR